MKFVVQELPYLDNWRWLSRQIRCGLDPNEPRLIEHYLAEGRYLARCTGTSSWMVSMTSFRLMIDSASDQALPWHWRCLCLDQAWRPLRDLRNAAHTPSQLQLWQQCAGILARCELLPSIPFTDLLQGYSDE